jgi:hypothetical protein
MSQQELLIEVAAVLDVHGIAYMITGSIASSLFGEPRLTHDIDVIVRVSPQDAPKIAGSFPPPRYYLDDRESIKEMIRQATMFNLIDTHTGDKVDFWVLTGSPFDQSRFDRRMSVSVFGTTLWVSSPEDIILAKLRWADLSGGSEKQFRDALRVFEVQREGLDTRYCAMWAENLGVSIFWERLLAEAEQ